MIALQAKNPVAVYCVLTERLADGCFSLADEFICATSHIELHQIDIDFVPGEATRSVNQLNVMP